MKIVRLILLPFSLVYGSILWLRNVFYNTGFLKSQSVKIKTICVGNISLGGTGKTPHIEYILHLLKNKKTAVLSRGYGRKTSGTFVVKPNSTAEEIGDEPLQIARKFTETLVVVDEDRLRGIAYIENNFPDIEIVLLDDAFQHRKIKAGLNILLTTFDLPFTKDFYLPTGNLRDHKIRAKQADIIVVTKSPEYLHERKLLILKQSLKKYAQHIFLDQILYKNIHSLFDTKPIEEFSKVVLVTGIAKPQFFYKKACEKFEVVKHYKFRDHYQFTTSDLTMFKNFIGSFAPGEICILTTEKDAMRLLHLFSNSKTTPQFSIFYWEIGIKLNEYKSKFDHLILNYAE